MSSRKNRSPEEQARRAKIRELLQASNISSMADIQNLCKETIAEFMENGLDAELDDELGYSKYDYKNKDTDNLPAPSGAFLEVGDAGLQDLLGHIQIGLILRCQETIVKSLFFCIADRLLQGFFR